MTDRELLELAAKAAGIEIEWHHGCGNALALVRDGQDGPAFWNPLADYGDALRLAAKLHIDLEWRPEEEPPYVDAYQRGEGPSSYCVCEPIDSVRRAIVCVAAEIGRQMK